LDLGEGWLIQKQIFSVRHDSAYMTCSFALSSAAETRTSVAAYYGGRDRVVQFER